MQPWHQVEAPTVLHQYGTDAAHGLSTAEAARRLIQHGPNTLIERGGKRPWQIVWEQLTATMVLILIVAAVISAALGDVDADAAARSWPYSCFQSRSVELEARCSGSCSGSFCLRSPRPSITQ